MRPMRPIVDANSPRIGLRLSPLRARARAGFRFDDRGMHALKRMAEEWRLFAVSA